MHEDSATGEARAMPSLAVLGAGNMGEAILRGLHRHRPAHMPRVLAHDPAAERRSALGDLRAIQWTASAAEAASAAEVILLAVKPQSMPALLPEIAPVAAGRLVVSIAAGVTIGFIESRLPGARVIRTMPNTPLLAGKGIVALCAGASATTGDLLQARALFPAAELIEVQEHLMDAVTAVSGSGPAYYYAFVEALAAAARHQGFDAPTAYRLAAGTLAGAAAMLEQSGASAADLRRRVTSPGGTTEAALAVLADWKLEEMVAAAVAAATERGRELSIKAATPPAVAEPAPLGRPGIPRPRGSARPRRE